METQEDFNVEAEKTENSQVTFKSLGFVMNYASLATD